MAKIPLEKTIGATYSFAFSNVLSVFGVLWLPSLILAAMVGALLYYVVPDFQFVDKAFLDQAKFDQLMEGAFVMARFAGLIALVSLLVRAMVTVGVMEKALGRREGPVFVYFSLGAPVWRLIGAIILAVLVIAAATALTVIAAGASVMLAVHYAPGIAGLVKVVAVCAAVAWVVYMSLRLTFFLPAVVVAEERIGLGRAWELGGGNFWRIVGLMLAVLLPVGIVSRIVAFALFGSVWLHSIRDAIHAHHGISPHEIADIVVQNIGPVWPAALVFAAIYLTLVTGLAVGAIGTAYKAVTAESAV